LARQVFFSFHHKNDAMRANVVRQSEMTQDLVGFKDAADWEKIKKSGDEATKKWINEQLDGTSVTVVLIGSETSNRRWVQYELGMSWQKGNGLVGIYIHHIKDPNTGVDKHGDNHFGPNFTNPKDDKQFFCERFKTYYWYKDDGFENLSMWIEDAAKQAGR